MVILGVFVKLCNVKKSCLCSQCHSTGHSTGQVQLTILSTKRKDIRRHKLVQKLKPHYSVEANQTSVMAELSESFYRLKNRKHRKVLKPCKILVASSTQWAKLVSTNLYIILRKSFTPTQIFKPDIMHLYFSTTNSLWYIHRNKSLLRVTSV